MHNKLFIADGAIAVVGGRNIADEYFMRSMTDNFVDMDAFIVGAVVPQLVDIFDRYWNSRTSSTRSSDVITSRSSTASALRRRFNALRRRRRPDDGARRCRRSTSWATGRSARTSTTASSACSGARRRAFADSPDKVTAMTDEEAREMSVTMKA